jgi:hypothetical protein
MRAPCTSATAANRCVACLLEGLPCSFCVYSAVSPAHIPACLDCVSRHGPNARGGCSACAQSGANAPRCFACMASHKIKYCADDKPDAPGGRPAARAVDNIRASIPADPLQGSAPACWPPTEGTPCDVCANAAKSNAVNAQCLACFGSSVRTKSECNSCALLEG